MIKIRQILLFFLIGALLFGFCTMAFATESDNLSDYSEADLSVTQGCHSLDAQIPLCGSTKILKTAGAAILYETNSQTLMYAWNADATMEPASLVKIMTALLTVENANPDDLVTVSANALASLGANSSTTDLQTGEQITVDALLYALLVGSSNDAALVLADHVAGSYQGFASMMNEKAAELGCTQTAFTNPHGLPDEAQYTTARDQARILAYACQNEVFMRYFSATEYTVPATNLAEDRELTSTNYMMMPEMQVYYDSRVTGGRTGITSDRNRCLSVTAQSGNMNLVAVILDAVPTFADDGYTVKRFGSYEEAKELLALGFDGYDMVQVLNENQVMDQMPVVNGANHVGLLPSKTVFTVLPDGFLSNNLDYRYDNGVNVLQAPVEQGAALCSLQVWYGNICVASVSALAANRVAVYSDTSLDVSQEDNVGVWSILLTVLLVLLGILALVVVVLYVIRITRKMAVNSQHKRRRAARRRSK